MRRFATGLLAATALSLPAQAEPVTEFTLDNGLEVVVIEDHRTPAVTQMLWYRAGAADEPPGVSGIAHFLEHLMFKGTDTREPGEFSEIVEAQGGRDNAFTSWDYTGYFQRVAADRLANRSFTEAEWLRERDVILEERGQVVESRPGAVFNEQMRAALFQNHPYGIPIIGWRHEMEILTGDDAIDFFAAHYGPENAVVVVAGGITAEEVRTLAETHYAPLGPNPAITERRRPQEPPHLAERRIEMSDPRVAQPYVLRQHIAPSRRAGDQAGAAALTVLAEILGGSPATSVLGRALTRGSDPVALSASAWYMPVALDDTTFSLAVVPAEGVTLAEAEAAMDAAVAQFLEDGVDPEQFARVRTRIRAAEVFGRDRIDSRARSMGAALTSGLTLDDVEGWTAALMAVTPEQVMAAAEAVFDDPRRAVTGWLTGPDGDEMPRRPGSGIEPPMTEVSQ